MLTEKIRALKDQLDVTVLAHYYQKDEVFNLADVTGDSLELAKKAVQTPSEYIVFCGVSFMGESVKVLDPDKRVLMPKIAACSMADMITPGQFDTSMRQMEAVGIPAENILPMVYINSSAAIKAEVGKRGGMTCTSSSAKKIMEQAKEWEKKIFFLPDQCLGHNMAKMVGVKSTLLGEPGFEEADVICYDGFCSVHQLFELSDVEFFREKYPDILIAVHPECKPEVVDAADFVGSTSQMIDYVRGLPLEQKVAVGTEYTLVNRLREANTYILAATRPTCPTMSETTAADLLWQLESIRDGRFEHEIFVDEMIAQDAKKALDRMMEMV